MTRSDSPSARRRGSLRGSPLLRLRFGFIAIAMVLSTFGVRLVQLQGLDPRDYAQMAANEGTVTVVLPASRGDILDRNGEPMARSVDGQMIIADPTLTAAKAPQIAKFLATRLHLDYFDILPRLRKPGSQFQYIARRVPSTIASATVQRAEQLGYKGLSLQRDPMRDYPAGDVAANLIGFMGTDEPLAGFERTFNRQLAGKDGESTYSESGGYKIPLGDSTITEPVNGSARGIAGVLNAAGNVLGMMPHPERRIEAAHGGDDGRRLFEGLLETVGA